MHIINRTQGVALAREARLAGTWWARLKGLLGKGSLKAGEGLVLMPCNAIHTCFMRFPIDVVFVNDYGRVLRMYDTMGPFRFSARVKGAARVVELPAGVLRLSGTQVGDMLEIE
ncbi:DUF192 domain-containing protein [bacterium]|nr:MAG: DUF192 domain-containing protein [bacterium]